MHIEVLGGSNLMEPISSRPVNIASVLFFLSGLPERCVYMGKCLFDPMDGSSRS